MTTTAMLALALVASAALFAVVLNHCYARLALVELTLNEGLPPGHERSGPATTAADGAQSDARAPSALGVGVHIFLSRSCHACQRLLDELDQTSIHTDVSIEMRYVDRPRPLAAKAAEQLAATLHQHQADLASGVGADPLPYTVAVGEHGLVGRSVSPTVSQVAATARDAGLVVRIDQPDHPHL